MPVEKGVEKEMLAGKSKLFEQIAQKLHKQQK